MGGGEGGIEREEGTANHVFIALFSQCSVTGRKWWAGSLASSTNELTASTYISGIVCTCVCTVWKS